MKLRIKKGTTSKRLQIFISDSSSTTGAGLTGLLFSSAGLTAYYLRDGSPTAVAITLVTATVGTYASGGFAEIDAVNMPGWYEFDPPDAALAAGAESLVLYLIGATNMAPLPMEIQLIDNTSKDIFDRVGAPAAASISADLVAIDNFVDELESRLTVARAGYLDNLNVAGPVASSAEATAIQNNTRVRVIVPTVMERPDTGSTAIVLHLYIYDNIGNMEAPDSLPTITAENQSGVDRSANLGAVTLVSVGHYTVTYTLASAGAIEQLIFNWSVVEVGVTRVHGSVTQVVDTTAVDFTAADRTKLNTLHDTRCTEARLAELDAVNLPTDVVAVNTLASAIKAVTDLLPNGGALNDLAAILLDTGTDGVALSAGAVDAILDEVVEGTMTLRQILRLFLAALAGKSAGGGTTSLTFRDNADGKNRITATVDSNGNRTAVTLDGV